MKSMGAVIDGKVCRELWGDEQGVEGKQTSWADPPSEGRAGKGVPGSGNSKSHGREV